MPFGSVWIPVIVSAVVVFLASSILHMVLRYHRADYRRLPDEDAVRDALGKGSLPPGFYVFPYCTDMKQMQEPAMQAKLAAGPVGHVVLGPNGPPAMGKHLGLWFAFCLLVSFVAGYLARHTLTYGIDGVLVMRVTGTLAFAAYGMSPLSDSIWKREPWANTARAVLDALVYAVLTGLTFRLLWPDA